MLRSNYELKDEEGTARALELLLKYYPSAGHLGPRCSTATSSRPSTTTS